MVDTALLQCENKGRPVRVAMIGAGASARAIALQLATPVPGIRLVGISNRTVVNGERCLREAGFSAWRRVDSARQAETIISSGIPVLTDNPTSLITCDAVDVVIEVTGTVDFAARSVLDAFRCGKHVILVNAELDSTLGPILKTRADSAGVVISHTDGDEPGVAMTLIRYLRSCGLRPVAAGNLKGMVDHYRTPETQRAFAIQHNLDARKSTSFADSTKLSMEATVLANATGFLVGRRGMYGPKCVDVREIANLLPPDEMLATGLVDYALGAAPHTGAFVIVHEDSPLKKMQLAYYKLGDGPFYAFYTPFHLPHVQIVSTLGQVALFRDPTVTPSGGPVCEVIAIAKRPLKAGERLDGVGGFCTYGLVDNSSSARELNALPMGISEDCTLLRDISKDQAISFADVKCPSTRALELWQEQRARWSQKEPAFRHLSAS